MKDFEKLDQLLWKAMASSSKPDDHLNEKIICQVREKNRMQYRNRRVISIVAILVILIMTTSISIFAAWRLLTPRQVAENLRDRGLEAAFKGKDALLINQVRRSGDYVVTLLGIVSGKKINDFENSVENIYSDRTYAVVAIERADGTPMPDLHDEAYNKMPFFASLLIRGQDPSKFNIISMNGGYRGFVKDGILYRIVECDDIEVFADRGIYLSVTSSTFYDAKAYHYDLKTGEITRNEDYEGINVLFELPIDPSKGNHEKAEKYLNILQQRLVKESTNEKSINIEALLAESKLIQESVEEVIPDKDGVITYHFDGHKFKTELKNLFKEDQVGFSDSRYFDERIKKMLVFSRNTNGVVTVITYRKNGD